MKIKISNLYEFVNIITTLYEYVGTSPTGYYLGTRENFSGIFFGAKIRFGDVWNIWYYKLYVVIYIKDVFCRVRLNVFIQFSIRSPQT